MIPQTAEWTEDGALVAYVPPRRPLPHNPDKIASAIEREQKKLRLGAGKLEAIASIPLLRRKLGATTYRLWATLLTMRAPDCETHPSLRGLAKAASMSQAQAAKSMDRLRQFKLVEDFGFMVKRVPCRCVDRDSCIGHKVYVRNVYGMVRDSGTFHYVAVVPRETLQLLTAAAGQGGKRTGAGRPKGASAEKPSSWSPRMDDHETAENRALKSKGGAYKNQVLVCSEEPTVLLQNKAPLHGACNSLSKSAGEAIQPKREALERFLSSTPPKRSAPSLQPQAQPVAPFLAQTEAPAAPAVAGGGCGALVDGKPCDVMDALRAKGARSIEIGGGYKGPRQKFTPEDLRATSSLSAQIEVLRVPAPPKVREEHSEKERLRLLRSAYMAVHEKQLRSRWWRPKREPSSKERAAMLAACEALRAKDLSPLAWAWFAFLQWGRMGKQEPPTPAWVWNAARIEKRAGWCHSEAGTLNSQIPFPLPAVTRLRERLAALRQALGWGRPTAVVVSEILPDEELRALLRQQAAQREAGQREIEQRINNGEWVWG